MLNDEYSSSAKFIVNTSQVFAVIILCYDSYYLHSGMR